MWWLQALSAYRIWTHATGMCIVNAWPPCCYHNRIFKMYWNLFDRFGSGSSSCCRRRPSSPSSSSASGSSPSSTGPSNKNGFGFLIYDKNFKPRSAVAQMVDRPSKVPVWCNSTDVGSNHGREMSYHISETPHHKVDGKHPSSAICCRHKSPES